MAIENSAICSSLWASCDELRGGMNASRYTDYLLFINHISNSCHNSDGKTQ